jgi:hypothetical protein
MPPQVRHNLAWRPTRGALDRVDAVLKQQPESCYESGMPASTLSEGVGPLAAAIPLICRVLTRLSLCLTFRIETSNDSRCATAERGALRKPLRRPCCITATSRSAEGRTHSSKLCRRRFAHRRCRLCQDHLSSEVQVVSHMWHYLGSLTILRWPTPSSGTPLALYRVIT